MPEAAPSVTQAAGLLAVHAHPAVVVTARVPVEPDAGGVTLVGDAVNVHVWPGCATDTDLPAMVRVAVRELAVVLAATVYAT